MLPGEVSETTAATISAHSPRPAKIATFPAIWLHALPPRDAAMPKFLSRYALALIASVALANAELGAT